MFYSQYLVHHGGGLSKNEKKNKIVQLSVGLDLAYITAPAVICTIKTKEPNTKGFTARNMWRMKQFYETYSTNAKLSTLSTQLTWSNNLLIL